MKVSLLGLEWLSTVVMTMKGCSSGPLVYMGLGRGKLSFWFKSIADLGENSFYCLVDWSSSSRPASVIFNEPAISSRLFGQKIINKEKVCKDV